MANLILNGSTSGSVTLSSPAVSGTTTLTLPTTTDTLVGKTTTDTLTNKTLTSPAIDGTPTGVGVLTSGTSQATTSGTSQDFTGIPSWVKRITVMLNGVSVNTTSQLLIQLGTSGGVVTSGYVGRYGYTFGGGNVANANGFQISDNSNATDAVYGTLMIAHISSNTWIMSGNFAQVGQGKLSTGNGLIALGATLDRVRITSVSGTATFDAGSINILYE